MLDMAAAGRSRINRMAMTRLIRITAVLPLVLLLAGTASAAEDFVITGKGIQYRDLLSGTGESAEAGDVATIHFTGWMENQGKRGRQIYNTRSQRVEPVSFVIGTDRVMQGWNEGVIGMRPGGRRLVKVPAEAAYGSKGVQDIIPPNARLIFIIDLIRLEKRHQ